jgi:YgiT-type zinc finger domain-containing protein
MKCTVCKNGTCKAGIASKMFDKQGHITIFKNVPAMICDNCGAKFFDGDTAAILLQKVREIRKTGSELEIINMKAA